MDTRLQALADASARIFAARSLDETLRLITEAARDLVGAHQAVTSLTTDGNSAQAIVSVSLSDKYAAWRTFDAKPTGNGIYALVCASNAPMRLTQAELEAHPHWRRFGDAKDRHPPLRGWLAAPLVARDGANLGLVQLSDKYDGEFDAGDEAIIAQLARLAALAVENQRLVEAAQTAERRFESFAKLGNEVLWETDAQHRYTSFVAKGTFRLRRPPKDFIGKTRWEATGVDPRDPFWAAHIADLEARRPLRGFEYQAELGDGKRHWIRLNAEPQFDAQGNFTGYRGATQDVTELRAAEAAAKANEHRFHEFADLGSDVLWETDENHLCTFISARPDWKLQKPLSFYIGKTRWDSIGADADDPRWRAHIAELEAHRPIRRFEYTVRLGDGTLRYLQVNGQPRFDAAGKFIGYRGATQDVTGLRAAEAAARASEERFREFAGIASDWLWETDARHRFTFFGGQHGALDERPYGMTRWEMAGADLADPKWREHLADLEAGRPFRNFEYTHVDKAGRTRHIAVSGKPIHGADGAVVGYRGSAADLTAQREAEAEALKAADQYRSIVETANEGVWILDDQARTVFVNRRMAEMLGYAPEEMLGREVYAFRPPEDRQGRERRWAQRRQGIGEQREARFMRRDGTVFWAQVSATAMKDASGQFAGSLGMVSDITARKEAEAAAQVSERKYRSIVETANEGIWILGPDTKITYANRRMAEMTGVEPEDLIGRSFLDFVPADRRAEAEAHWRERNSGKSDRFETRQLRNDGSQFWALISATPMLGPDGAFAGTITMFVDISARKAAEAAAAASEARFRDFAEIASDWMWETDREHRLTYISGSKLPLDNEPFGRTRWELSGAAPDDPHWRAHIAQLEARAPFRDFEFAVKGASGRTHHLVASGRPIFDEHGDFAGYRGTTTNRTQQREAEAAAAASERKFRQFVETANEGVWMLDAERRTTYANQRIAELLGYSVEELVGRPLLDFKHERDHAASLRLWEELELVGLERIETRLRKRDGSSLWVLLSATPRFDAEGKLAGSFIMLVDITARKAAEQAAERAKRELDAILASTSDGVTAFDNEWRFTYINAAGERIARVRAADIVGRTGSDAFHIRPDNIFRHCYLEAKRDGQPVSFSAYSDVFGGWHEIRAYPHPEGLTVFFRDVTGERQAQLALAESERKLRAALESNQSVLASISDGFVALDNAWRFTFVNPAAERIWNLKAADLLGKTILNSLKVDPENAFQSNYLESKRSGDPVAFAAYSDIFEKWIEVRGYPHPAGYTLFFDDVTEERRAHRALLKSEKRLEAAREMNERIFETSLDLICVTDRAGDFVEVNPGACKQFGYAKDALIGHNASEFIDAEGIVATRAAMRDARRSQSLHTFENKCRRGDGSWVPVNWSVAWSEREQKFFLIGRDMSEQIAAQERLNRSQRLEAIGQLTGGIAHDFNNLLTVIMGNSDTLARGLADRENLRRRAELSLEAARRAAELTAQLLAFARRQTLAPKAVEASRLVAGIHELMRRTLGAEIEIGIVPGESLWLCKVDSTQLETALLNLALNARDAMPGGGRLSIATANRTIAAGAANGAGELAAGDYVTIAVADTGAGMTAEVLARAFEPFFTTKDIGKGSGLGLAMVYGFVKQSGGGVAIESAPGRGTKVTLYLPRAQEAIAAAPSAPAPEGASLPGGRETILVVEDDPAVRELVTDQLRALGYRVLVAGNGSTARNILFGGEKVDLLFTDVMMPGGITGTELAAEAEAQLPGLKILFTTGYSEVPALKNSRRGVALLRKPYKTRDLARTVRETLDAAA